MRRLAQLDLLLAAAGFLVGTVCAGAPAIALVGLGAACLARLRLRRRWASVTIGFFAASAATALRPPPPMLLADPDGAPDDMVLHADVIEGPRHAPHGASYVLEVHAVDDRPQHGRVRLFVPAAAPILAGDRVETFARCRPLRPPDFPGLRGERERWEPAGVSASCTARETVQRTAGPQSVAGWSRNLLTRRRLAIEAQLHLTLGRRAGVPLAMLTGTRGFVPHSELRAHQRAGTAHLLAISGVHFGALATLTWLLAGVLLRRSARITRTIGARRASAALVFVVMVAYLVLVGAPISAVRACIAMSALVLAVLSRRRASGLTALALAVIVVLLASAGHIDDLGFRLSFVATLSIVLFWQRLPGALERDPWANDHPRHLGAVRFVLMSWCATAATAPLLLGATGELSVVAFFTNLFAVPVVSLFIFPALLVGTLIAPAFGELGGAIVRAATEGMLQLTMLLESCGDLPGAVVTPGAPPGWWTHLAVATAITVIAARLRFAALATGLALTFAATLAWLADDGPGGWSVHFIPVGQGDATLVQTPSGRRYLIDAGGSAFGRDPGRAIVVPYLRRLGITHLDAVVITHPDIDHVGGVPAVLEEIDVARVVTEPTEIEGVALTRWAPSGSRNDRSLVAVIDAGPARVVLPGDVEGRAEANWVADHPHRIDVLKVAHHGSATSSTAAFVDRARPAVAVVSAGPHNRFGHPRPEVLARLRGAGARVYSTAAHGLVVVSISTDGVIEVRTRRAP